MKVTEVVSAADGEAAAHTDHQAARSRWTGQNHRHAGNHVDDIAGELNLGAFLARPAARAARRLCSSDGEGAMRAGECTPRNRDFDDGDAPRCRAVSTVDRPTARLTEAGYADGGAASG